MLLFFNLSPPVSTEHICFNFKFISLMTHSFSPGNNRILAHKPLGSERVKEPELSGGALTHEQVSMKNCEIGKYACCIYDGKWWVGLILETSEEENDVSISFMHPHGPATSFHWPSREDTCFVPLPCILCIVNPPSTPNGRQYYLDVQDKDHLAGLTIGF